MSELLDGTNVPWHLVSGKTEPGTTASLPAPARRDSPASAAAMSAFTAAGIHAAEAVYGAGLKFSQAVRAALPQEDT